MQPFEAFTPYFMHDVIAANVRAVPDKPALIWRERTYSWRDFERVVEGLRRGLVAAGVVRSSRVAIIDRNSDDYVFLHYAVASLGAVLVPINMWLRADEVRYILSIAQPAYFVIGEEFRALADAALEGLSARPRIIARGARRPGDLDWDQVRDGPEPDAAPRPLSWDDPHLVLFTSGTTGQPKGALISHRRSVIDCLAVASMFVGREDRLYCYMPLFHTGAWDYLKLFFMQGGSVVLVDRFDASEAVRLIERHRCNLVFGVPLVLRQLVEAPEWPTSDMSSMRIIAYASFDPSDFLQRMLDAFRERGAAQVSAIFPYGLTEGGPFVAIARPHESAAYPNSVGNPVPGVQVAMLDDDCNEVPLGEIGEICVRSPALMSGYLNQPEATAEAFRGGWMHTGDLGRRDEDGFIYVVDRKKDMIRTGAENVYAKEVEQILILHPGVSDCAVVGVPDPDYGEQVVAAVVAAPGAELDAPEVIAFVRKRIAGFKTPKRIVVVDALPQTSLGKVAKHVLRQDFRNREWEELK